MRKGEVTYQKILNSMAKEVILYDYTSASMHRIAKGAGISPAAIYRHFDNKAAIFTALMAPREAALLDEIESAELPIKPGTIAEGMIAYRDELSRRIIDLIFEDYRLYEVLFKKAHGSLYTDCLQKMMEKSHQKTLSKISCCGVVLKEEEKALLKKAVVTYDYMFYQSVFEGEDKARVFKEVSKLKVLLDPGFYRFLETCEPRRRTKEG